MKKWQRIALLFAGAIIAISFPFLFDWEKGGGFVKALLCLVIAVVASSVGSANFIADNNAQFDYRPKGVEAFLAAFITGLAALVILAQIAQW